MPSRVLNFGSLNIDHVYRVPHFVRPGETLAVSDYAVNAGGKGLNQSIALRRSGADVYHGGQVGEEGRFLAELLESEGVHTDFLLTADAPTGHAIIQVSPEGENSILITAGANGTIPSRRITEAVSSFGADDFLVLQNEINRIDELIEAGAARGLRVIFNPAPMSEQVAGLPLDKVSILAVNEHEACQLAGHESPEIAAEKLRRSYPETDLLLTLGADGVVFFSGEVEIRLEGERVAAVDTTAAGDTFIGYFVGGLSLGLTPLAALEAANRAAAICVTRAGAAESIPTAAEVGL